MSKKASKRYRRRRLEQANWKPLWIVGQPTDALPTPTRLQIREPFYLHELGLHNEPLMGSVPRFQEGAIIMTGRR